MNDKARRDLQKMLEDNGREPDGLDDAELEAQSREVLTEVIGDARAAAQRVNELMQDL